MSPARPSNAARRGFSLVEAVVAMGVMAILLLGMGGALSMSVTAVDRGRDPNSRAVLAASAADVLLADLNEARTVTSSTPTRVLLTVPDRNGDSIDESIEYRWPGGTGDLYRSVNGTEQVLLAGVDRMALDFFNPAGSLAADSAEQVLASCDAPLGATISSRTITDRQFAAQYLKPAFDANVTAWRITRLKLRLSRSATPTGRLRVSIVQSSGFAPTGSVLASLELTEASLPGSSSWVDVAITAGPLTPSQGVFIVLRPVAPAVTAGVAEHASGGTLPYNTFLALSADAGAIWSGPTDAQDLRFFAFGTVTTH